MRGRQSEESGCAGAPGLGTVSTCDTTTGLPGGAPRLRLARPLRPSLRCRDPPVAPPDRGAPAPALWGSKTEHRLLTWGSRAVRVAGLAGSRVRDSTDAVSDVRPPGRLDGAARAFFGVEGRGVVGFA